MSDSQGILRQLVAAKEREDTSVDADFEWLWQRARETLALEAGTRQIARYRDFMCIHNDEGKARCDACLEAAGGEEDLLTRVVYGMEWGLGDRFHAQITSIGCDQWAGVSAEILDGEENHQKCASIWVECDVVEHGIARVWEICQEHAKGNGEKP